MPSATRMLVGNEASHFLRNWKTTDPKAATAIGRARLDAAVGGPGANQVVVLTGQRAERPSGVVGWLSSTFSSFADEYYYTDGGVMVISPFEDPDPNIAAFDVYYADSEGSQGGTVRVDTTEAAYGDPDVAVNVESAWVSCAVTTPSTSVLAKFWISFTGVVSAQTSHKGGACQDLNHMDDVSKANLKGGIKAALFGAGAAAIPCIGATIGWALCVGGAAIGAAAVSLGWDMATMLWDCRCTWFGISCDDDYPLPI